VPPASQEAGEEVRVGPELEDVGVRRHVVEQRHRDAEAVEGVGQVAVGLGLRRTEDVGVGQLGPHLVGVGEVGRHGALVGLPEHDLATRVPVATPRRREGRPPGPSQCPPDARWQGLDDGGAAVAQHRRMVARPAGGAP
jgi:hypothetical protein